MSVVIPTLDHLKRAYAVTSQATQLTPLLESAALARETGAARVFGVALTTGLTVEDVEAWPRLVDAVTREQVLAAARYVLDLRRSVTGYLLPKEQS